MRRTKRIKIFDAQSSYFVAGGIAFGYILSGLLCAFFFKRFVLEEGQVAGGMMLIAMFLTPWIYLAVVDHRTYAIRRFLVRCKFDAEGIHCGGLFCRKYIIPWKEIHVYGTYHYAYSYRAVAFIFLSKDRLEYFDKKRVAELNRMRIIFDSRPELWPELGRYMPEEMRKRLQQSLHEGKDCFYRM